MEAALYPPGILDIVILAALALCILLPPLLAPRRFLGILKLLRPLRLLHYAGFAAGGAVVVSGFASHATVRLFPLRMLILVVVTLTATFGTKDMADVEGDRRRGIRTLFTLLGLGKH
ncbi:hypothetical protein ES703_11058 [subsurface metagenome]|nr:hypothetical protein [bacterium]